MPAVHSFNAIQYRAGRGDVSDVVAPPYDVLDAPSKAALLARSDRNIVAVDLPHTPAKELGPPGAYDGAGARLASWLRDGTLARRPRPAMFAYRQTFEFAGGRHRRSGMACTVDAVPFGPREGGGVLPHEETFSGPKEDRFALMKATRTQLSPVFGLHADRGGAAVAVLGAVMDARDPDMTAATPDGVRHEVWAVEDERTIGAYREALRAEDIFIADGHHRYTTGLNYIAHLGATGPIGADHPARRSMMVLVSMSDPGLVIGPTHRVLGGMSSYSIDRFIPEAGAIFEIRPASSPAAGIEREMAAVADRAGGRNVLGLIDAPTGTSYVAVLKDQDPLRAAFPGKPAEWRTLDVAIVQHLIVEKICQPVLNGGRPVTWAFPHSVADVLEIIGGRESAAGGGAGFRAQLAVIVRPTPLSAVRAVSLANQLMPQKSTFFYPKLATGLFMNPLA